MFEPKLIKVLLDSIHIVTGQIRAQADIMAFSKASGECRHLQRTAARREPPRTTNGIDDGTGDKSSSKSRVFSRDVERERPSHPRTRWSMTALEESEAAILVSGKHDNTRVF